MAVLMPFAGPDLRRVWDTGRAIIWNTGGASDGDAGHNDKQGISGGVH
jgi:hypothetical protein